MPAQRRARSRRSRAIAVVLAVACFPAAAAGQTVGVEQASEEQTRTAADAFKKGNQLFDEAQYADAEAAFRDSLAIVASPSSRLMLARALEREGKLTEAYEAFETTRAEASALAEKDAYYVQARDAATKEQADLRARVALLTVTVRGAADARVEIDGVQLDASVLGRERVIVPGHVVVAATAP